MPDLYDEWCRVNNCEHGHCPHECEHPQPRAVIDPRTNETVMACGRCLILDGVITAVVPCGPEVC